MLGKTESRKRRGRLRTASWMAPLTQNMSLCRLEGVGELPACCRLGGRRESDTPERLNSNVSIPVSQFIPLPHTPLVTRNLIPKSESVSVV